MSQQITTYIQLQVKNRNRATVFFRAILVIPIAILAASFGGYSSNRSHSNWLFMNPAGVLMIPVVLTLLFLGVYPSYVLQFNKAIVALSVRISSYFLLLTDDYPSIEANEKIGVEFPEIQGGSTLSRGLPLVKWLLAIPLYIVGAIYSFIAALFTVFAWIHVSITGTYPGSVLKFVLGTLQFWNRVVGYALLLVTDEYPPFTLELKY